MNHSDVRKFVQSLFFKRFRSKKLFAVFGWYFTSWIQIQEAKILRIQRIRILSTAPGNSLKNCQPIWWCYRKASTRKRTQKWVWVSFLLFSRIIRNPSKTKKCRGISEYFGSVSAIFTFFFWGPFPLFLGQFLVFRKTFF